MNLHGFTPQEYRVIEELLKVSKELYVTVCCGKIDEKNILDDSDVFYANKITAKKLIEIANKNNAEINNNIYLDKKYRFKSDELNYLEENIYENIYKKYEKNPEKVELFLAANPYSEVEHIANKIVENVRDKGYRYKEIVVITKNIDNYSSLIKAIFSKYDIPVYIDEKKDLSQNILIKYIICVLDVFAKNWSYDSVMAYVKTKFCEIDDEDIYALENYCKKCGIKYSKWYREDWRFRIRRRKFKKIK